MNREDALAVGRVTEITPRRPSPLPSLGGAWAQVGVTALLAERDLRVRYRQTALGVSWAVIQPVVGVVIFSVVFGRLTGVPSDGVPYPLFVLAGLVIWLYVSSAVTAAATSLTASTALVTKTSVSRGAITTATVGTPLVDLAIGLGIVIVAGFVLGRPVSWPALMLPVWVVMAVCLALGLGLLLSALNVRFRDVRYATPFLMQAWIYASPVVFPTSLVDPSLRPLYAVNPMVGIIEGFRWSMVGGPAPGWWVMVSAAAAVAALLIGTAYFRASERSFADVI